MKSFTRTPENRSRKAWRQLRQGIVMNAVRAAVVRGDLPPQATLACIDCNREAEEYDHRSLAEGDELMVVPVCHSCNVRRYRAYLPEIPPYRVLVKKYGRDWARSIYQQIKEDANTPMIVREQRVTIRTKVPLRLQQLVEAEAESTNRSMSYVVHKILAMHYGRKVAKAA